jgi:hypothetical protein
VHSIQKHLILLLARIQLDHQGFMYCSEEIVQLIYSFRYQQRSTLFRGLKTGVYAAPVPWRAL